MDKKLGRAWEMKALHGRYKKHFDKIGEATTIEEVREEIQIFMDALHSQYSDMLHREDTLFENRTKVRLREAEVQRLKESEFELKIQWQLLQEEKDKLDVMAKNLGLKLKLVGRWDVREIVALYRRWRNYPKVAKKMKMKESEVRQVVEAWRSQAKKEEDRCKHFKGRHFFNEDDDLSLEKILR